MAKITIVCSDRDGAINRDENYYLGSSENWKDHVEFLPGVVEGIRLFNRAGIEFFIVTNQSGVALGKLDVARMHEVNKHLIEKLAQQGARVNGYFACPYVDAGYAAKAKQKGRRILEEFVNDDCIDLKPKPGMVHKAVESLGLKPENCMIYTIGDRYSDVLMGINAGGTGILVPSTKTLELSEDTRKVKEAAIENPGRALIFGNYLEASEYIVHQTPYNEK